MIDTLPYPTLTILPYHTYPTIPCINSSSGHFSLTITRYHRPSWVNVSLVRQFWTSTITSRLHRISASGNLDGQHLEIMVIDHHWLPTATKVTRHHGSWPTIMIKPTTRVGIWSSVQSSCGSVLAKTCLMTIANNKCVEPLVNAVHYY